MSEPKVYTGRMIPLNTWGALAEQLRAIREETDVRQQIALMNEAVVNLRLLDDKSHILPDKRDEKGNIDEFYDMIYKEAELTLNSVRNPSLEFTYYARELLKKLPIRDGGADIIGDLRSAAEQFDESREEDDPLRGFAADLRKEVHRKLSSRIMSKYIEPYFALLSGNKTPMTRAGYAAASMRFNKDDEDQLFIDLATEMREKLGYLWDYGKGNISRLKDNVRNRMDFFEKCFLKTEVESFLKLCEPHEIRFTHNLEDCLNRLINFKKLIYQCYLEGRVNYFDYLNVDLDLGRFIFIFTNDLTNNHYSVITYGNFKDCARLTRNLSALMLAKGILKDEAGEELSKKLTNIEESLSPDFLQARQIFQDISAELQNFLRDNTLRHFSPMLNTVLGQVYHAHTSDIAKLRDRFFNSFIRTTEFHAVSEFIEKILAFLARELSAKTTENSLYGRYSLKERRLPYIINGNYSDYIACTWKNTPERLRPYLGGKGNGIIDMHEMGVKVPAAFILGLPICENLTNGEPDHAAFSKSVESFLREMEQHTGKQLGNPEKPLLVSARSGATISMPGSMCTILNVGLTPEVRQSLSKKYGTDFSENLYLRFLKNVLTAMEKPFSSQKGEDKTSQIRRAEQEIRASFGEERGRVFFENPLGQLIACVELIFASSHTETVKNYLKTIAVDYNLGTAVTVQQMAFGNLNANSMTGVVFTRNPITGADELFGEYREMAQGEDVVMSNIITRNISGVSRTVRDKLNVCKDILERGLKHELDLEFTVEDGTLYLLQARRATVSPYAKLKTDISLLKKGIIDAREFKHRLNRLNTSSPNISIPMAGGDDFNSWNPPVSSGMSINPGVVWGQLVLTQEKLEELAEHRQSAVLFYQNTKPSDFYLINNSHGIATIYPGRTSHAAITSITLNKPCVVGCHNAKIDLEKKTVTFKQREKDIVIEEGTPVTLDANSGSLYMGQVQISSHFLRVRTIIEAIRALENSDEIAAATEGIISRSIAGIEKETSMNKKMLSSIKDEELAGRKVLVRADFNVPIKDGVPEDPERLENTLKTLDYLLEHGATPIVCSHRGDPSADEKHGKSREELYENYTLAPAAAYMEKMRPGKVHFHSRSIGSSGLLIGRSDIISGRINILENLRFAIGETENDPGFCRNLASLAARSDGKTDGIFVNDAFGACHRSHASITGIAKFMQTKAAGFMLAKEIKYLGGLIASPQRPFTVIAGGADISTKYGALDRLLKNADSLFAAGSVALTLLKAKGAEIGISAAESKMTELAKIMLKKYGSKIILPVDFMVINQGEIDEAQKAGTFDINNMKVEARPLDCMRPNDFAIDIGPESLKAVLAVIEKSETAFWNGPVGMNKRPGGETATNAIAAKMAEMAASGKTEIAGGASTVRAVKGLGLSKQFTHLSVGSTACIEYLERIALPGITALDTEE